MGFGSNTGDGEGERRGLDVCKKTEGEERAKVGGRKRKELD